MKCFVKGCRQKGKRFVEVEWYKKRKVGNLVISTCGRHSLEVLLEPSLQPGRKNQIRGVTVHERSA